MRVTMPPADAGRVPEWTVADRLRKARESAGLEQRQLADRAGISRATISAAENGSRPARATMRLWAMACGVPLSWIETGRARPTASTLRARQGTLRTARIAAVLSDHPEALEALEQLERLERLELEGLESRHSYVS